MSKLHRSLFKLGGKVSVILILVLFITGQSSASTTFIINSLGTDRSTALGQLTLADNAPDDGCSYCGSRGFNVSTYVESFHWEITGGHNNGRKYERDDIKHIVWDVTGTHIEGDEFNFWSKDGTAYGIGRRNTVIEIGDNSCSNGTCYFNTITSPIPEPEQYLMLIMGLAGMFGYARYRRRI